MRRSTGFTLIELIVVITVAGIIAVMMSVLVGRQMSGYVQLQQRAQLVQMADSALQKIALDIHRAVPNSVRVNGNYLELVPVVLATPYRSEEDASGTSDKLDFSTADASFDVLADMISSSQAFSGGQVVVYNLGLTNGGAPVLGANLYASNPSAQAHVISSPGVSVTNNGAQDVVSLDTAHQFSQRSPNQKMYLVNGAITYHCDAANGTLIRYGNYAIQESQPTNAGASPLSSAADATLANQVSNCVLRYSSGSLARNAVVSLQLTLSDGEQSTTLMKQVQINNVP